jgi:hypothetical protein
MYIGYWWESQEERYHWGNKDLGGWTILKWILERWDGILEVEGGSSGSHSLENSVSKRLWTCHKTDYYLNLIQICIFQS